MAEGQVEILREGAARKFLRRVEQVTFSGARAARIGQPVLYVTERCVFELTGDGLKLTEIAPGINLGRDILAQMRLPPIIEDVQMMDARIFRPEEMGLRTDLLHLDLPDRIALDPMSGQLFLNFEKLRVRSCEDIARVQSAVEQACDGLVARVDVIANYDGFRIDEPLETDWARMVAGLTDRYYGQVSRYSGSAFMRMKLSQVFPDTPTHIFETSDQARAFLDAGQS
ncbi:hypothetical protein [uncultured Maritalea sp.]|uniref:hypothetical protein n=1 Tax=uncultured Maritalea sp. TaxID=757249 RepID=UPI00262E3047|nr:hypothetical protein [uncultured Maritalea sp.]